MSINFLSIFHDIATWASAAKLAGGAFLHKAYTWIVAKFKAAETDVKAEVKKL